MSKDRLLSDEELKEKIDTILENEFYKGFETANEGFGGRDSYNLNKIINFINTQKRLYAESVKQVEEVKNLYDLRKLYDEYEIKDRKDLSGEKIATWQGYKFFRNPISDRIEAITGVRHDQGVEEWLRAEQRARIK